MAKKKKVDLEAVAAELREHAFRYPEATEDFPWGERAIKVKGKVYVFMRDSAEELSMSCKLPQSRDMAADLPFAEPTHYGMGKYGWVTASFAAGDEVPVDLLKAWIDESWRAVAPKKLVKSFAG